MLCVANVYVHPVNIASIGCFPTVGPSLTTAYTAFTTCNVTTFCCMFVLWFRCSLVPTALRQHLWSLFP